MAQSDPKGNETPMTGWLSLLGAAGIVGLSLPASAAIPPQRIEFEARVAAARQQLRDAAAGRPGAPAASDAPAAQFSQWNNWPNFSNWSNWANG
jgi:hypothetical protein